MLGKLSGVSSPTRCIGQDPFARHMHNHHIVFLLCIQSVIE